MLQNVATMSIKRRVSMLSRPARDPVGSVGAVRTEDGSVEDKGIGVGMKRVVDKDRGINPVCRV